MNLKPEDLTSDPELSEKLVDFSDWLNKKTEPLQEQVGTNKWLFNLGLCTDFMQNNLVIYGYLADNNITNVSVTIDFEKKIVAYDLYFNKKATSALKRIREIGDNKGLWSLFIKRRLLKKFGPFNFKSVISRFVKDLCGSQWNISINEFSEEHNKGK